MRVLYSAHNGKGFRYQRYGSHFEVNLAQMPPENEMNILKARLFGKFACAGDFRANERLPHYFDN